SPDRYSAKWDRLFMQPSPARGRAVLEIVAPHERDTYRAVYTVRFQDAIYMLHALQKKSKKGIATPQKEVELVKQRLAAAERDHRERQN
ncbi:MAG: addiction module toxin RelE, partial [Bryobacterales bacterium]|nr:addiction module toxin RelE [Bryobacterales bacterium]